tara:strand:- start:74 stop:526 length:453 start_codon:yes stop_codon:yes gene_type:complete
MKAISITLILLVYAIGCQEVDSKEESIIGEWYLIGGNSFDRGFLKYQNTNNRAARHKFTKDSLFSWGVKNQVLDSSLALIDNGVINDSILKNYDTWEKIEGDIYKPSKRNGEYYNIRDNYFEISGDTLIHRFYKVGLHDLLTTYFFKKTN